MVRARSPCAWGQTRGFYSRPHVLDKNKPVIIPFQNGIYAEEELKKKLPYMETIGAVAQISVFVDKNQIIKHIGKLATFFVGGYDVQENKLLEYFCDNVQKTGLKIVFKKKY